jgi:hypothetical protein
MSEPKAKAKLPPYVNVYTSHPDNPKVAALTDAEYRAWHLSLASARHQTPCGQWPSRAYLEQGLGAYAEHIDVLVKRDLIRVWRGTYFSANFDTNQPGVTSDTHRRLQESYREAMAYKKEQARLRQERKRHGGVTPMSRSAERGTDRPTLLYATPRSAALSSAALPSATNSSDERTPVAPAPYGAPLPLTRQDDWTPVPCIRCGAVIVDRDKAYEGGGPEAIVHLNECPV